MAIIILGTAHAVAFKVCANRGGANVVFGFLALGVSCGVAGGVAGRYLMLRRRLW